MASSKTNFILGLLLTASVVQLCNGEDPKCTITARKCEFPFSHDGTAEKNCIPLSKKELGGMEVDDEDSYYCKLTDPRQKFKGMDWWGQCNEACFINGNKDTPRDCSGGEDDCPECKNNQVECKFNFTYKDVVYNGCTDTDSEERWCATKVNEAGEYISGFWGFCDSGCLDHCEQDEVNEVKDAEATSKKGTHIAKFAIQEWKNACKMNFSGVFTHLDPDSTYKLFVIKENLPDDAECPPNLLDMESTEFGEVTTDEQGKVSIHSQFTRKISIFGENSVVGKMVVLESPSQETEDCAVIRLKEDDPDIIIIIIIVLVIVILLLLCLIIGLCVYCCKKNRNNTPPGQKFEQVPNSTTDTPDGKNGIKKSGPFGSQMSIPWIDQTPSGSPKTGRSTEWLAAHFSRSSSVGRSRGSLSDMDREVQA